jgi:hypothetical protein
MNKPEQFHYCIGNYIGEAEIIQAYTYLGDLQHGTLENAKFFLAYVKKKKPERDWKIFKVTELENTDGML